MKLKRVLLRWLLYLAVVVFILGTLIFIFSKGLQVWVDNYSVKNLKQELLKNFVTGNVDSLKLFLDVFNLEEYTKPIHISDIKSKIRQKWSLRNNGLDEIHEEEICFSSSGTQFNPSDSARFFVYRKDNLKNSKIILWVPGLGVSDLAFCFIKYLFITEIKNGYTVIVYIPPFHLNRKHPEKENGEGFIGSNIQHNIQIQLEAVRELRTLLEYLEQQEPKEISAWGGSMGASFLLLTSKFYRFEHINLMIPMIDWEHTMMQNKELKSLLPKYASAGFDSTLLANAFKIISPANYQLNLPSDKTMIQFAEYDQLTSKKEIIRFASKNNIDKVVAYPRSHATILLSRELYSDYEIFLGEVE